MPNKCKAQGCQTYIGDSQDFCRRHWDLIPWTAQKQLRKTAEAVQHGEPGAAEARRAAIADAVDLVANKEREARLKSRP